MHSNFRSFDVDVGRRTPMSQCGDECVVRVHARHACSLHCEQARTTHRTVDIEISRNDEQAND